MTIQKLYVQASALNVRNRPTTDLPQGKVIKKLTKGTLVDARVDEDVAITSDAGSSTYPSPFEPDKGEKWVYISAPVNGWAAAQMGSATFLSSKKPDAGYDGGGNDNVPNLNIKPVQGDFPILAIVVMAGAWWWFKGRKR